MTIDLSMARSNLQPHTLVAILEESCMASKDMQWPFNSGERIVAYGPFVYKVICQPHICIFIIVFCIFILWDDDLSKCQWIFTKLGMCIDM